MPRLHLGRFLTNEGGIGGLVGGLSKGWTGVNEYVEEVVEDEEEDVLPDWMRPGKVSGVGEVEAEMRG